MIIAGVDEVGRGAIAGNVVSAAIILKPNFNILGLNDSKKLSEKRRNFFYEKIIKNSISIGIGYSTPEEIYNLNILNATMLSMKRALSFLLIKPDLVLIDGDSIPYLELICIPIIKGDSKIKSIMAASIIAKVTRDNEMTLLNDKYIGYNFTKNKGYPTKEHIDCIYKIGLTSIHRKSFSPIRSYIKMVNES